MNETLLNEDYTRQPEEEEKQKLHDGLSKSSMDTSTESPSTEKIAPQVHKLVIAEDRKILLAISNPDSQLEEPHEKLVQQIVPIIDKGRVVYPLTK